MYNLQKNNYHLKPKNSNIYTPPEVSQFIFELLRDKITKGSLILDPCCGQGNLLRPWKHSESGIISNFKTYGIDIDGNLDLDYSLTTMPKGFVSLRKDFLIWDGMKFISGGKKCKVEPDLVLCNPPFNGMKPKLAPEIWLDKIIELFGKDIPIVLFAPIRMRLCSQKTSPRYQKWTNGTYPPISSIISLPTTGIFEKVDFFIEILIFNIKGLEPHYFFKPHE